MWRPSNNMRERSSMNLTLASWSELERSFKLCTVSWKQDSVYENVLRVYSVHLSVVLYPYSTMMQGNGRRSWIQKLRRPKDVFYWCPSFTFERWRVVSPSKEFSAINKWRTLSKKQNLRNERDRSSAKDVDVINHDDLDGTSPLKKTTRIKRAMTPDRVMRTNAKIMSNGNDYQQHSKTRTKMPADTEDRILKMLT